MRDSFRKVAKYASHTASVLTLAGFGYIAMDAYLDNEYTPPDPGATTAPDLSTQFGDSSAGSPIVNPSPQVLPVTPITLDLGNGYALRYNDGDKLLDSESLVNMPRYDAKYDNYDRKTPALHAGLLALSQMTPLNYNAFEAAVWKETRFQPHQENKSGAKGYFQMKPEAFYEGLYRATDEFPQIADVTALVHRTREKIEGTDNYLLTYAPVSDTAKAELDALVHDPLVSGLSYYSYISHYMENFVQKKIPELTDPNQTDLYLISFRGPGGATEFLQNLRNNPDHPAHNMYSSEDDSGKNSAAVKQNKGIYYDAENDHWRSYQEVYDHIADTMGIGRTPIRLWKENPHDADVIARNDARDNVIPTDALIFAENITRPRARPSLDDIMMADSDVTRPKPRPQGFITSINVTK